MQRKLDLKHQFTQITKMEKQDIIEHFESAIKLFKGDILEIDDTTIYQTILHLWLIYYAGIPEIIAARHKEQYPKDLSPQETTDVVVVMGKRMAEKKDTIDWIGRQIFKFSIILMDKFTLKDGKLQLRTENFPDKWNEQDKEVSTTVIANVMGLYNQLVQQSPWSAEDKKKFDGQMYNALNQNDTVKINLVSNSNVIDMIYKERFKRSKMN